MLWRQATAAEKRGAMAQRLMRGMPTGRACLLVRRQPGVGKVTGQSVLFREGIYAECAFPYGADCRMRFSVECAFPYLDKRDVTSRKGAFWPSPLTQKRILAVLKTPECALP